MEVFKVIEKFGGLYAGDNETYEKGTHFKSARKIAGRFSGKKLVLDACCGAGFVTIHLARDVEHVIAVDINADHIEQTRQNVKKEGLSSKVTTIHGDIMSPKVQEQVSEIDSAFLDPNWTPDGSVGTPHATSLSQMQPDGGLLFSNISKFTSNIAFRLPKEFDLNNLSVGSDFEIEEHRSLNGKIKFFCAYFGDLKSKT